MKLTADEVIQALNMMEKHVNGNSMQLKLHNIEKEWTVEEVLEDLKKVFKIVKKGGN
jgi:Mg/Co/Ni transporter MgtE